MLGDEHAIPRQHLGVKGQLESAYFKALLVVIVELDDAALIEQHDERIAQQPARAFDPRQIGGRFMLAPPGSPGLSAFTVGVVVMAQVYRRRLLARQTEQQVLRLPCTLDG